MYEFKRPIASSRAPEILCLGMFLHNRSKIGPNMGVAAPHAPVAVGSTTPSKSQKFVHGSLFACQLLISKTSFTKKSGCTLLYPPPIINSWIDRTAAGEWWMKESNTKISYCIESIKVLRLF